MLEAILGGLAGFLLGSAMIYLWARARTKTDGARIAELEAKAVKLDDATADKVRAESALEAERGRHAVELESAHRQAESLLEAERQKAAAVLDAERRQAAASLEAERRKAAAELTALRDAHAELEKVTKERTDNLRLEFNKLTETILKQREESLQTANAKQLTTLLNPLREQLTEYRKAVEDARVDRAKLHSALKVQYESLAKMTEKIGADANNLARALKGENKTQGDWGEMILETILKDSGLVNGVHYETQATLRAEDGQLLKTSDNHTLRPDVVVHYPDGKDVVIDSKVSLSAFTDYVNAEDPAEKKAALDRHVRSVRAHVDELAKKNYPEFIRGRDAVDFVIMFIPNEPPHQAAMLAAPTLWREAFDRHVLIVSPVNLMALLQMIRVAWTREEQARNQKKILETASLLLDRVVRFHKVFEDVGTKLNAARQNYDQAAAALTGRMSVVGAARKLHELGVSSKKHAKLPDRFYTPDLPDSSLPGERDGDPESLAASPDDGGGLLLTDDSGETPAAADQTSTEPQE